MAVKGKNVGKGHVCPNCKAIGRLVYTSIRVERGSGWSADRRVEHRSTPVPVCRCEVCRRRYRVLPIEITPFKHYTREVIETACAAYSDAQLPDITLRKTVDWLGSKHPHYSSLHGWIGGLGERALGLLDKGASFPVSALIAETAKHHNRELPELWARPCPVAPRKYRSEKRAEQLEGCARVFATAAHLFPEAAHPFCAWEKELQEHFHVAAWSFPARGGCTAIQHHAPGGSQLRSALSSQDLWKPRKEKSHGARSPP